MARLRAPQRAVRVAVLALVFVFGGLPVVAVLLGTPPPYRTDEMRPVLAAVAEAREPDDTIWVFHGARHAIDFYGPRTGFETWEQGEFLRLCVIEALFSGGWRNRDTWRRFELRDETAVAGIKFRALKRLRQLAAVRESGNDLLGFLAAAEEGDDQRMLDLDVRKVWREKPRPQDRQRKRGTRWARQRGS